MSLQSTSTANGWARDLADKLTLRFKGGASITTVRAAQDASAWPMLFLSNGSESAGQPVIGIRIQGIDVGAKDIFGNSTIPFAPHSAEVAYELTTGGFPTPVFADLTVVLYEISKLGVKVIDKAIAHNTAVTESSMNAAAAVITVDNIDWPNKGA